MGATDRDTPGSLRDRVVYDIASACKLLADPVRFRLLLLMAQAGEINVGADRLAARLACSCDFG